MEKKADASPHLGRPCVPALPSAAPAPPPPQLHAPVPPLQPLPSTCSKVASRCVVGQVQAASCGPSGTCPRCRSSAWLGMSALCFLQGHPAVGGALCNPTQISVSPVLPGRCRTPLHQGRQEAQRVAAWGLWVSVLSSPPAISLPKGSPGVSAPFGGHLGEPLPHIHWSSPTTLYIVGFYIKFHPY